MTGCGGQSGTRRGGWEWVGLSESLWILWKDRACKQCSSQGNTWDTWGQATEVKDRRQFLCSFSPALRFSPLFRGVTLHRTVIRISDSADHPGRRPARDSTNISSYPGEEAPGNQDTPRCAGKTCVGQCGSHATPVGGWLWPWAPDKGVGLQQELQRWFGGHFWKTGGKRLIHLKRAVNNQFSVLAAHQNCSGSFHTQSSPGGTRHSYTFALQWTQAWVYFKNFPRIF